MFDHWVHSVGRTSGWCCRWRCAVEKSEESRGKESGSDNGNKAVFKNSHPGRTLSAASHGPHEVIVNYPGKNHPDACILYLHVFLVRLPANHGPEDPSYCPDHRQDASNQVVRPPYNHLCQPDDSQDSPDDHQHHSRLPCHDHVLHNGGPPT